MTGQDIMDACDRWIASDQVQVGLSRHPMPENLEKWLRFAFTAGIEAAESEWRDPMVDATRLEQEL